MEVEHHQAGGKEESNLPNEICQGGKKFDDLLSAPAIIDPMEQEEGRTAADKITREAAEYEAAHQRFRTQKREHAQQYAPLYFHRLQKMRPRLLRAAKARWGTSSTAGGSKSPRQVSSVSSSSSSSSSGTAGPRVVAKILELRPGEEVIVAGTLYKEMPLRPNILETYAKERSIIPPPIRSNYSSERDSLIIEDESGRIRLVGAELPTDVVVTGIILAVKGTELPDGDFQVSDIIFTGIPPQPERPILEKDRYLALVSGIAIGDEHRNPLAVQLLVDYITGHIGSSLEQEFESRITRLIIAGNTLVPPEENADGAAVKNFQKRLTPQAQARLMHPVQEMDMLLSQLASSIHVDIMPGSTDPANYVLPQQPFNPCLFPKTAQYTTFRSVTNPYHCHIEGVSIIGHSGQPVDDIKKYTDPNRPDSALNIMEDTLNWSHLAPTTPDTLGSYPFTDEDPFILEECPHIYFAANQPTYETRLIKGPQGQEVRLVSVPSFVKSNTLVLVNLRTLATHPISFAADFAF